MSDADLNIVSPAPPARRLVAEVWQSRELLAGLVTRELKVRYKGSVLGFVWTMVNPAMYLAVFYLVFDVFLGAGIPSFAIFLLSSLLVWNLFSGALSAASTSIVGNGALVNKVWFPRAVLPLASVGAGLVHFALQSTVLITVIVVARHDVAWDYVVLLPVALAVVVLFATTVALFVAAANVYARDTQHLLELALLAWFWMTPIVYPFRSVADRLAEQGVGLWVLLLNPLTSVVITFQRAIYGRVGGQEAGGLGRAVGGVASPPDPAILPAGADHLWYLRNLGIVGAVSLVLLVLVIAWFRRVEGDLAESL